MLQLVWRSADHGEWTWSSPQWSAYTGQMPEQSASLGWLEAIHPDDRDKVRLAWAAAHLAGVLEFEARIRNGETGRYRYFQTRAAPVRAPDGRILEWLGTSTDMDDLLRLQEQQSVLVGELQHRTRNLMAVVQAIMLRTIKTSDTLDDFRICIEERLGALARVQGLLSRRNPGNRVPFDVLLREELSAHVELDATGNGDQVTMQGPPGIPLRSSLIQTLALALHELATNAVKYGALAVPSGHLAVRWTVENDGDRDRLVVDWRETGVQHMPTADAPARGDGYGRELIEKALPYQLDARTAYTFTSDGVHCVIDVDIPLSDRLEVYNG
jgi:two-component sensor histidine kinase